MTIPEGSMDQSDFTSWAQTHLLNSMVLTFDSSPVNWYWPWSKKHSRACPPPPHPEIPTGTHLYMYSGTEHTWFPKLQHAFCLLYPINVAPQTCHLARQRKCYLLYCSPFQHTEALLCQPRLERRKHGLPMRKGRYAHSPNGMQREGMCAHQQRSLGPDRRQVDEEPCKQWV